MDIIQNKYIIFRHAINRDTYYDLMNEMESRDEAFLVDHSTEIKDVIEGVVTKFNAQLVADLALLRVYKEHIKDPSGYGTRVAVLKEKILERYPETYLKAKGIDYEFLSRDYPGDKEYKYSSDRKSLLDNKHS